MDSKLVVEQLSGRWQIKHEDMRALAAQARAILPTARVRYTWVPRSANARADRLANEAMDAAAAGRAWSRGTPSSSASGSASGAGPASSGAGPASSEPESARAPRGIDLGPPTVLLLVRHGRTPLTEQRRLSGAGGTDPELSKAGRGDAERVAALLAALGRPGARLPDVGPVGAVVCSPLRRTRQTAGIIADRLGLPVAVDQGWVEIGFGDWDGFTPAEIAERWPEELAAWQGSVTAAPPGGESLAGHVARIEAARAGLVAEHPGEVVVVVAHATPIRCVLAEALDAGPPALWRTRISPASVTVVRYWADTGTEVLTVNTLP